MVTLLWVVKTTDSTLFGVQKLPDVAIVMNASSMTHLPGVTKVCQDHVILGLAHMILLVGSQREHFPSLLPTWDIGSGYEWGGCLYNHNDVLIYQNTVRVMDTSKSRLCFSSLSTMATI